MKNWELARKFASECNLRAAPSAYQTRAWRVIRSRFSNNDVPAWNEKLAEGALTGKPALCHEAWIELFKQ